VGVAASSVVAGNEFGGGWFVWVDDNANGVFDVGEEVVRTREALPANAVTVASSVATIVFSPLGFVVPPGNATFTVCPVHGTGTGYNVVVQPNGLSDVDPTAPC
jgi:type IV fimbrial biogenesis protein FimT